MSKCDECGRGYSLHRRNDATLCWQCIRAGADPGPLDPDDAAVVRASTDVAVQLHAVGLETGRVGLLELLRRSEY